MIDNQHVTLHINDNIKEYVLETKPIPSTILFILDTDKPWIMKIENNQIHFNREDYPDALPNDFAVAVMEILERSNYLNKTKE